MVDNVSGARAGAIGLGQLFGRDGGGQLGPP
jgi:hypothetical protein